MQHVITAAAIEHVAAAAAQQRISAVAAFERVVAMRAERLQGSVLPVTKQRVRTKPADQHVVRSAAVQVVVTVLAVE